MSRSNPVIHSDMSMAKGPQTGTLDKVLPQVLHTCGQLCGRYKIPAKQRFFRSAARVEGTPRRCYARRSRQRMRRPAAAWSTKSS